MVEISSYCEVPPAMPAVSNAIVGTVSATLNSITTFTCNMGYTSDGGSSPPYFACLAYSVTQGTWSTANWGYSSVQSSYL